MMPPPRPGPEAPADDRAALAGPQLELVVFAMGSQDCALPRQAVQELLPLPRLWVPPGLPRPLDGFLNLGGQPVPVLALAPLLGLPEDGAETDRVYHHLILLRGAASPLALRVPRVLDMRTVPVAALRPVSPTDSLQGFVTAGIPFGPRLVHLLDADRLLLERERAVLESLAREATRRRAEWALP
ncbi:chemotaxis protein CheW [Roseomonas sp. OT10]|uniref:chemotaxis protein CheW n=1 Tax=Roseomonas cutis TaxID=2897332 RepID=UPI001E5FD930|nr:chemotaxis protein CheW [Roseomonas sp. OT10]UFN48100.1 chemotaxis protein CheW [Roseomonas sp. OT10]